jgi:hypothetical protein
MLTMRLLAAFMLALAGIRVFIWANNRRVHRTREEVITFLQGALQTGGNSSWDDFVSVRIAEPELEAVRVKCCEVNLSSEAAFNQTLQSLLVELTTSKSELAR